MVLLTPMYGPAVRCKSKVGSGVLGLAYVKGRPLALSIDLGFYAVQHALFPTSTCRTE